MLVSYPPGAVEPVHINHSDGEIWLVLDGALAVEVDGVTRTLGVGESIQVAAGAAHRVANPGETPAMALSIATPGVGVPEWLNELAALEVPDPAVFADINARYHVSVPGPSGDGAP